MLGELMGEEKARHYYELAYDNKYPPDRDKIRPYFDKGCEAKVWADCTKFGYLIGGEEAQPYYDKACFVGDDVLGCKELRTRLDENCKKGNGKACSRLGDLEL